MKYNYEPEQVGQRIKKLITDSKLTYEQCCEKLFISSRQTLYNWVKGKTMPSTENLFRICELFDCQLSWLLCEPESKYNTWDTAQIGKETGLSNHAIEALLNSKEIKPKGGFIDLQTTRKALGTTITLLLEDQKNGLPLLQSISDYIHEEFSENESELLLEIQNHLRRLKYGDHTVDREEAKRRTLKGKMDLMQQEINDLQSQLDEIGKKGKTSRTLKKKSK